MDINDQIAANLGLVYKQLVRFNLREDQDAESYAYEALYRAVQTYDESTGNTFATYAVCVIANELRKHIRTLSKKRQLDVVSYDMPLGHTEDEEFTLLDTIAQADNAEEAVLFEELNGVVRHAFSKVYEESSDLHKDIIKLWYDSDFKMTQSKIAEDLHVSQTAVSRALSIFKHKVKIELEEYM